MSDWIDRLAVQLSNRSLSRRSVFKGSVLLGGLVAGLGWSNVAGATSDCTLCGSCSVLTIDSSGAYTITDCPECQAQTLCTTAYASSDVQDIDAALAARGFTPSTSTGPQALTIIYGAKQLGTALALPYGSTTSTTESGALVTWTPGSGKTSQAYGTVWENSTTLLYSLAKYNGKIVRAPAPKIVYSKSALEPADSLGSPQSLQRSSVNSTGQSAAEPDTECVNVLKAVCLVEAFLLPYVIGAVVCGILIAGTEGIATSLCEVGFGVAGELANGFSGVCEKLPESLCTFKTPVFCACPTGYGMYDNFDECNKKCKVSLACFSGNCDPLPKNLNPTQRLKVYVS